MSMFHQSLSCLFILVLFHHTAQSECSLSAVETVGNTHHVTVQCGEDSLIRFSMTDTPGNSELRLDDVRDGLEEEWLGVEFHSGPEGSDMFITIDDTRYNVKDEKEAEEHNKILELFKEPDFRYFTPSVKLIHDELMLKGWQSTAVMCLYTLALAAENYSTKVIVVNRSKRSFLNFTSWFKGEMDKNTILYHGSNPQMPCKENGRHINDITSLSLNDCEGICGPSCHTCWVNICGDCCYHKGCKRHDEICGAQGYISADCISVRGVLWDTLTNTAYDC